MYNNDNVPELSTSKHQMRVLYFKAGTVVHKVARDPNGCCNLAIFNLKPASIKLDGIAGTVDPRTCKTEAWFLEQHNKGESQETAIEVTGVSGRKEDQRQYQRQFKRSRTAAVESLTMSELPTEAVDACKLWKIEVQERQVPCSCVPMDELLDQEEPLLAELRFLNLLLDTKPSANVEKLINMRLKRQIGKHQDMEVAYHPVVLEIYKAAAAGQEGITFAEEAHTHGDSSREDIRGLVKGIPLEPSEVKATFTLANAVDPSGIHNNADGFGKIYKCMKVKYLGDRRSPVTSLGTLISRSQCLWFLELNWAREGSGPGSGTSSPGSGSQPGSSQHESGPWQLQSCRVSPSFPSDRDSYPEGVLMQELHVLNDLDDEKEGMGLSELMQRTSAEQDARPPIGFRWLSRYVTTLARMHELPATKVRLIKDGSGELVDVSQAKVLAYGHKTLVVQLAQADEQPPCVIKISAAASIKVEHRLHLIVDGRGCRYIRRMVGTLTGKVEGAGGDLRFLGLEGECSRTLSEVDLNELEKLYEQAEAAVTELHLAGVLHRDIKPSNMLLDEDGNLKLNDFDVSCTTSSSRGVKQQRVGTDYYRSPRLEAAGQDAEYSEVDDWLSLCLSFAEVWGIEAEDKQSRLQSLADDPLTAQALKTRLSQLRTMSSWQ